MANIYAAPNLTGGLDETLVEVATTVPSFIVGLLLFVWGFVFVSGTATQKKKTGYADSPMWAVMASLSTMVIALMLTIKGGLISIDVLGIVMAITIFSGFWLFMSKGRGEI